MADTNIPAKLKSVQLAAFAKRAVQLERFKPIITYWLRFYMVQKIISAGLHTADPECTAYTTNLMEKLELAKSQNPGEDALLDEVAASAYCEQFALQTFAKGEKEMAENRATKNTVDTLLAASSFLEILSIWKKDPEPEIRSKQTFAKYHALRIMKAINANEDPNLTNPKQESPPEPVSPVPLDPNDPDVRNITEDTLQPPQNPYQPSVESAPNTSAPPSPTFSSRKVSPPPNLPSAPTGYSQSSHADVSPISQPSSRQGSVGGGYFPRVDVPTFTADAAVPSLPTAPSIDDDEPMSSPFQGSSLPTGNQMPQAPQAPTASDPSNFYQAQASPPLVQSPPQQPPAPMMFQSPPPQPAYSPQPPNLPPQQPHSYDPRAFQPSAPPPPPAQQYQFSPQPQQPPQTYPPPQQYSQPQPATVAPPAQSQGPFHVDEEGMMEAQKHAKWAISALNFEDVNTAVKELRIALRALGAN